MKKLRNAVFFAVMITTLVTSLILSQISSMAITFDQGDLVTILPSGEKFYYTESSIKWDEQIKKQEITSRQRVTNTGQIQTIETVRQITSTQLIKQNESKYIEIVMQIPQVVVCTNQARKNADIRIIKLNQNSTTIKWKKQVITEANIIKIVGEVVKVDIDKPDYEFIIQITFTGEYLEHMRDGSIKKTYVENQVIEEFKKVIIIEREEEHRGEQTFPTPAASSTPKISPTPTSSPSPVNSPTPAVSPTPQPTPEPDDSIIVREIEDVILKTELRYEESQYREIKITKSFAHTLLTDRNLKLRIVKSNYQEIDEESFQYEVVKEGEQYKIRFWSRSVKSAKRTAAKLIVEYTSRLNRVTTQEVAFNVIIEEPRRAFDRSIDVN